MLVYIGQGNMSPGSDNNGLLYSSLTSPGLHCRVIQGVYWSGENKAPDTTNPTLLKDTVLEVVESWFGQESLSVVTLTYKCSMEEIYGMRYCNEILDAYVQPYATAIGNDFILMDDNA